MTITLILLLLLAAGSYLWSSSRDAAEVARIEVRNACQRAGVQFLDQSVALRGVRLQRDEHGRLRWLRRYQFDYSCIGHDRLSGAIAMLGNQVHWITEPTQANGG